MSWSCRFLMRPTGSRPSSILQPTLRGWQYNAEAPAAASGPSQLGVNESRDKDEERYGLPAGPTKCEGGPCGRWRETRKWSDDENGIAAIQRRCRAGSRHRCVDERACG